MRLCPAWGTGGLWVPLPVAAALTRVRWCRSLGSQLLFSLCNYEVSCRELLCDFVNVPSRLLLWLTNFSLRPQFLPGIAAYAFDERASPRPSPLHGYYSACAVRGVASPHVWIEAMIYTIWTHGRLFYSIGHDRSEPTSPGHQSRACEPHHYATRPDPLAFLFNQHYVSEIHPHLGCVTSCCEKAPFYCLFCRW